MQVGRLQLALLALLVACIVAGSLAVTCGDLGDIPLTGCSACQTANTTSSTGGSSGSGSGDSNGDGNGDNNDDGNGDRRHLLDRGGSGHGRGGGVGGGGSNNGGNNGHGGDNNQPGDDDNDQGDSNSTSVIPTCTACVEGFVLISGSSSDSSQSCGCPPGLGANLTGYTNASINNVSVPLPQFTCGNCSDNQVPLTANSGLVPFFNGTTWTLVLSNSSDNSTDNSTDAQVATLSRRERIASRGNGNGGGKSRGRGNGNGGGSGRGNGGGGNGGGSGRGRGNGNGGGSGRGRGGGHGGSGGGHGGHGGSGDGNPPAGSSLPWFPGSCVDCPVGSAPNADKTACVAASG